LITTDKPTVITKLLLDLIVVENGQGGGRLANSASTNKSDWSKVLSEIDYLRDQIVASKEGPWGQRRGFSRYARFGCKMAGPLVV